MTKRKTPRQYDEQFKVQAMARAVQCGSPRLAAEELNIPYRTLENWLTAARTTIDHSTSAQMFTGLKEALKRQPLTDAQIAQRLNVPVMHVPAIIEQLQAQGAMIHRFGEAYQITGKPAPQEPGKHVYTSQPGGYYKFGYTTDNHLCSKYAREDVLDDLYNWFAAEKVDRVFNTGNWIDGEARFNKHDIFVHGMQNQLNYFCERYPRRTITEMVNRVVNGGHGRPKVSSPIPQQRELKTYLVAGDDHEGWYGQREGVDIGWQMEQTAKDIYKRTDLVNLGFVESFVKLQHADKPNAWTYLLAVHPGGGSAYATSYAPQKYVEALQGGEKPAVILFGHWHKMFDLLIRNVICLGGGCTKDLDPFGRKNKLAYHVGGMIVELWQDDKGAISRWRVETKRYFDRGYHNDQWSYTGTGLIVPQRKEG